MLKIEKTDVLGWEHAIRGMRNPMNSWENSDSDRCANNPDEFCAVCESRRTKQCVDGFIVGADDRDLMLRLAQGGPVHAKYRRMIVVYADITAPLYWWKEFDTYKVGTVANSCSTMHKIQAKEFVLKDFSCEHLTEQSQDILRQTIQHLNMHRAVYLTANTEPSRNGTVLSPEACTKLKKDIWWQMIQLLPSSYNQKRTVMMNYEVLAGIYPMRKDHKLDEWHIFCDWIKSLPYSELITGKLNKFEKGGSDEREENSNA